MTVPIKIKKLENFVDLPKYQRPGDAGMDLFAAEDAVVYVGSVTMIDTGIAIQLPDGYEAQIRARSGMASKGIIVTNSPGTIDSGYIGPIKVLLSSVVHHQYFAPGHDGEDAYHNGFKIKRGDRIAQMVIAPIYEAKWEVAEELSETERGHGGFGSTG